MVVLVRFPKKSDCSPGPGGPHTEAPMWTGGRKEEEWGALARVLDVFMSDRKGPCAWFGDSGFQG